MPTENCDVQGKKKGRRKKAKVGAWLLDSLGRSDAGGREERGHQREALIGIVGHLRSVEFPGGKRIYFIEGNKSKSDHETVYAFTAQSFASRDRKGGRGTFQEREKKLASFHSW